MHHIYLLDAVALPQHRGHKGARSRLRLSDQWLTAILIIGAFSASTRLIISSGKILAVTQTIIGGFLSHLSPRPCKSIWLGSPPSCSMHSANDGSRECELVLVHWEHTTPVDTSRACAWWAPWARVIFKITFMERWDRAGGDKSASKRGRSSAEDASENILFYCR